MEKISQNNGGELRDTNKSPMAKGSCMGKRRKFALM